MYVVGYHMYGAASISKELYVRKKRRNCIDFDPWHSAYISSKAARDLEQSLRLSYYTGLPAFGSGRIAMLSFATLTLLLVIA